MPFRQRVSLPHAPCKVTTPALRCPTPGHIYGIERRRRAARATSVRTDSPLSGIAHRFTPPFRAPSPYQIQLPVAHARATNGPPTNPLHGPPALRMLTAVYHILKNGVPYRDMGPAHFDRLHKVRTVNRLVDRLNQLGYNVAIQPKESAA